MSEPAIDGETEPAAGGENESYQALITEAVRAYRAGSLIEARELFMRAHELSPNARTLRGLGVVALAQHEYRAAIEYLGQSLGSQVKPLDDELRKGAEDLLQQAQQHMGRLRLVTTPADSEVWLDGAVLERDARGELVIEEGSHRLEVRHAGYMAQARTLEVRGRENAVLDVTLARVADAPAKKSAEQAPERRSWLKSPWLWGVVGLVVVGGVTTGVVVGSRDRYDGGSTGSVVGR